MNPPHNFTPTRIVPSQASLPEAHATPVLSVRDVSLGYALGGQVVAVLDSVSLNVGQGEFVSIVGPSGCGKSTLLRVIAGLEEPDSGAIALEGRGERLGLVGWMPQRDLLHPWLDAVGNAAAGLEVRGVPKPEARERARTLLAQFGLAHFERAAPRELSVVCANASRSRAQSWVVEP
jgi:ABC-type nitrate/sulfonate/bicarbonate transport system ATPase subunit